METTSASTLPFFSRAYGGFTNAQEEFFLDLLGDPRGKTILDPMAGQAFSLSALAERGANVWLGDLNPAPLLLAYLRDPQTMYHADRYADWFSGVIGRLKRRTRKSTNRPHFVKDWVAPEIGSQLRDLASLVGIGLFADPFSSDSEFWDGDDKTKFAAAIVVMAARDLTCYRTTDNVTWLKPGGLLSETRIIGPLRNAPNQWVTFAAESSQRIADSAVPAGSVNARLMNVECDRFADAPKPSWIITSPPYANRLDYTRFWAPEINVLASMCEKPSAWLKAQQLGTTVVEDIVVSPKDESALPASVKEVLAEIKRDPADYSDVYYHPFFRNYAVSLMRSLVHIAQQLRSRGTLVIFVRDTVRKDVLFPTGELVTSVLTGKGCELVAVQAERKVIRQHIGFLRKASSRGLYGLAQLERWLVFRKNPTRSANGRPN